MTVQNQDQAGHCCRALARTVLSEKPSGFVRRDGNLDRDFPAVSTQVADYLVAQQVDVIKGDVVLDCFRYNDAFGTSRWCRIRRANLPADRRGQQWTEGRDQ